PDGGHADAQQAGAPVSETHHEAVAALTMLGFSPAPSAKVVGAILKEQPLLPVEQVVKMALKMIK
ncbi:MAG: Holliday junction branch migration protein RuvA, partial [Prevotella sp.]|nr:Holliday junction branch migration protein RuvA [Prevotella sp.]